MNAGSLDDLSKSNSGDIRQIATDRRLREKFYGKYAPVIHAYFVNDLGVPPDDADNLTNSVVSGLVERLRKNRTAKPYDANQSLQDYLRRIACEAAAEFWQASGSHVADVSTANLEEHIVAVRLEQTLTTDWVRHYACDLRALVRDEIRMQIKDPQDWAVWNALEAGRNATDVAGDFQLQYKARVYRIQARVEQLFRLAIASRFRHDDGLNGIDE